MEKFEEQLKHIQNLIDTGSGFLLDEDTGLAAKDLDFLAALGLISRKSWGDNKFQIGVTPEGIAHFHNKQKATADFWKGRLVNFILGLISGVGVTLLAAWLLGLLQYTPPR